MKKINQLYFYLLDASTGKTIYRARVIQETVCVTCPQDATGIIFAITVHRRRVQPWIEAHVADAVLNRALKTHLERLIALSTAIVLMQMELHMSTTRTRLMKRITVFT
jgi:hypothetical protein